MSAEELGVRLYDRGWRQGVVFSGARSGRFYDDWGDEPLETPLVGEMVVLATQDCDLVKPEARIPYLEALPALRDKLLARRVRPNDQRFFVLDPEEGLVADRAYRILLSRRALLPLEPVAPPCGGDARRARRFAQWLGSAYDRPALPDAFHKALTVPLVDGMTNATRPDQPLAWLNRDLHEVRVAADLGSPEPWQAQLLFVLTEGAQQDKCDEAIAEILATSGILPPADESLVSVTQWTAARLSEISVLEYAATIPIGMDTISLGTEDAARPLNADPT